MPEIIIRKANNYDFNRDTTAILMKIDVYFDGDNQPPLTIDLENYLITATILEETGTDSDWPLGLVSSNELSFRLYSYNGMFSPTNPNSPYYGKIKTRVKVRPYFKPRTEEVIEWEPMGVFYVTEWSSAITGITADVLCHDILWDAFNRKPIEMPIRRDLTYKQFYEDIFTSLNIPAIVDPSLDKELPWAFLLENSNARTIQELTASDLIICSSNREGIVEVKPVDSQGGIVDQVTDLNQIKDATTEQSISKAYSGSAVTYNIPQLAQNARIAEIASLITPPGTQTHEKILFSQESIYLITGVQFISEHDVKVVSYTASSEMISVVLNSPATQSVSGHLVVYGMHLDKVSITMGDTEGEDILATSNMYVQTLERAQEYKLVLDKVVKSNMPDLDLMVRGNPLICLGDELEIISERYNLHFFGRLRRAYYKYDGDLDTSIRVIDSNILT